MERVIKFRIWFKTENRWLETPDGLFFKYPHSTSGEYFGDFIHDPYFPQQFTGLLDKNGKEIYEGDIVHYIAYCPLMEPPKIDKKFQVEFNNERCAYNVFAAYDGKFEVIGNIFENPELLNYETIQN
jgi:uncharacterized phage protein (TIGR01671 family)